MTVWDSVRSVAVTAGTAAKLASAKAKLRAEIALVDREIEGRKRKFGVEMFDHCSPLTEKQSFYADDDKLTITIRPPLLQAQKEISALEGKKNDFKQVLADKQTKRAGSFPVPATTFGGKAANAGKTAAMMGSEVKTKTDVAVKERQILTIKQEFGLELYDTLVGLEDQGWLPPDRNVRSIYDQCRRDLDDILKKKDQKKDHLRDLGGGGGTGGLSSLGNASATTKTPAITYRDGENQQHAVSSSSQIHRNTLSMASQYGSTLSNAVGGSNGSMQTKAAAGLAMAATAQRYGSAQQTMPGYSAPAGKQSQTATPAFGGSFSSSSTQVPPPKFETKSESAAPTASALPPPEFQASFPSNGPPAPPAEFQATFSSSTPATSGTNTLQKPSAVPTFQNNDDLLFFNFDD